jgi:hypothetical protein
MEILAALLVIVTMAYLEFAATRQAANRHPQGRYSTPFDDGRSAFLGSAVPMSSR